MGGIPKSKYSCYIAQPVKGVVHSVVRDLQFLGNFLHGIAFISQNKKRLTSFGRKLLVSGRFEPGILDISHFDIRY
jgi:hypothetical protein